MYLKDLGERMTLRLTEDQREFLVEMANMTGMRPSEYIRMMINTSMWAYKRSQERSERVIEEEGVKMAEKLVKGAVERHENVKTSEHDKL